MGCDEAFTRVNRDIEWTLRSVRHVNRKLEAHKENWRTWSTQAEERSVQEWYAQAEINKKLQLEDAAQKRTIEEQQRQIDHLYQLLNGVYGELEQQKNYYRSMEKSSQLPEAVKKEHQP